MRWPVSFALYDAALRDAESWKVSADAWESRFDEERRRADYLSAQMLSMKAAGAVLPETRQPVEAKEPDAVQWAINEKAGNNHALRLHLTGYAARERLNQVSDEEIVSRLTKWHSETDD